MLDGDTVFIRSGWYGLNFFSRGAFVWTPVSSTDARLSHSIRLALQDDPPLATPGPLIWTKRADGFDTAELAAFVGSEEVDRILLARLDPEKYRFQIHSRPAGDRKLGDWMRVLDATLVVNGSYFDGKGAAGNAARKSRVRVRAARVSGSQRRLRRV